jgi:prevent-host-death family protein
MNEMITVTAAEFQRHFGRYQDEALTQRVTITRNGRARLVMISAEEYRRLIRGSREVLRAGELSDADLAAIAKARAPEATKAFDDECNQT